MRADVRDHLSDAQLAELRRIRPLRSLGAIAWTWGWICACFGAYIAYPSPLAFAAGWAIMSGRHLALAILMHEGAHRLLMPSKAWNDRIAQWLTAYPVMLDMHVYRKVHLLHHNHTWTERDPDLALATGLPVTRASFRRKLIRDLTGQTAYARHRLYVRLAAGLSPQGQGLEGKRFWRAARSFARNQHGFLITNAALLGALSALGHAEVYVLLWVLPAFTGYSVVLRIRSIAEHACVSDPKDSLRNTRTTLAPFWVRFLLAPHHVNYHLEHHLYMGVPHYNLPRAHRMLRDAGVLAHAEVAPGYLDVLRRAISKPEPAAAR